MHSFLSYNSGLNAAKKALGKSAYAVLTCAIILAGNAGYSAASDVPLPSRKPAGYTKPQSSASVTTHAPSTSNVIPVPVRRPLSDGFSGLSEKDARLYAEIFHLQQEGLWEHADAKMELLDDFYLRGHVLYQRYMHPAEYRSRFTELRGWLDLYSDHPGADKIYKLALSRAPKGYRGGLRKPDLGRSLRGVHSELLEIQSHGKSFPISKGRSSASRQKVSKIIKRVKKHLRNGGPTAALRIINDPANKKTLTNFEYANIQAEVARTYLHLGYWEKAEIQAKQSIALSKGESPLAGWIAGLISWKKSDFGAAAAYFENAARYDAASPWMISAGAYWAARSHMRNGSFEQVGKWLKLAAQHQRTFYGLIAIRALGYHNVFKWNMPAYTPDVHRQLIKYKNARRAFALVQAGQVHLAEEELKYIRPEGQRGLKEALLAYAHNAGLPAYQMRLGSKYERPEGGFYDTALYPLAPWQKSLKGELVDEAVINAFIRQESKFRSGAENPSGATGLMQVMPATANYVMRSKRFSGSGRARLKDPITNMQIGERYIRSLLRHPAVDGDLFSLAIAYNAGPGNLRRWKSERNEINDPLLFIETIPVAETRAFVERVMSNIWIYRQRLRQATPTLDAVTSGQWPIYVAMD